MVTISLRQRRGLVRAMPRRQRFSFIDIRPIALVVGIVLVILACFMIPPMIADLAIGHPDWQAFFLSASITAFIGVNLVLTHGPRRAIEISARQAFMMTTLVWLLTAGFAALPFALSELHLTPAEAAFEAMSGLTTTGATVIVGLDFAPPGILLWRAILQWLGGIGIIVMGVAILPMLSVGGMQLFRTESSDLSEKILPRAAQIASAIGIVYLTLTIVCASAYWLAGMQVFDAVAHSMTTISTGGMSTSDESIAFHQSAAAEWVAVIFMITGGIPFVLYFRASRGDPGSLWRDTQVRWFLSVIFIAATMLTAWLHLTGQLMAHEGGVRHAVFTTVSVVTGTGYASVDYGTWGSFAVTLLFFLMCMGGCTGSTTGGIKMFRFAALFAIAKVQRARLLQPSGVFRPIYNGQPVPDATAISILAFIFLFALSFAVAALVLSMFGLDYLTAMSGALTALANVGPGLGDMIGPAQNFAELPEGAKWVLSATMLLGRLELLTVLVLFTPAYWRD